MVASTYDEKEDNRRFSDKHDLTYPLLEDKEAGMAKLLGILNEKYEPGHMAYGIPHPGMYLLDENGVIFAKFAEEGYKNRPAFDLVKKAIEEMIKGNTD